MRSIDKITFVVPVNDDKVFNTNFYATPLFAGKHYHQILTMSNFSSASKAYNAAIEKAGNDLIVFTHQDMYLPETWITSLEESISHLEGRKINWGVLGCFGSRKGEKKGSGGIGQVYTTGMGIHGRNIDRPEPVETLDEIVLIIRKSSGLRFDPYMPNFHLYGTDICMSAREKGMSCYAIPAFCIHNTNQIINLPAEFYECYRYIKRKWQKYLPIYTSCMKITRFDKDLSLRRIHDILDGLLQKKAVISRRAENPQIVLDHLLKNNKQRNLSIPRLV
jgi:hypothetical protein